MQRKKFNISIHAPRNIVWHVLWSDANYRAWAAVFHEGSHAQSDWQQGSDVYFLGPDGTGMYSVITKKDEPSVMLFTHGGEMKEGKKLAPDSWAGAEEIYTLKENGDSTELTVEMDIEEEYLPYFEKSFPLALQKIKELSEQDDMRRITVQADIHAPVQKVWKYWTMPEYITKWNTASEDWHTPRAENDVRKGGKFLTRMEAKDGSAGFDFSGTYDEVKENEIINYTMDDQRKANIRFSEKAGTTHVSIIFDAEQMNPIEMQRFGWQAILDNFKKYTEQH